MEQPTVSAPGGDAPCVQPAMLPDVATEPHPVPHYFSPSAGVAAGVGDGVLGDALPAIKDAANKVGGFKRLAEIAAQLDREGMSP